MGVATSSLESSSNNTKSVEPVYALPPYKRNLVTPKLPEKNLSEKSEGATYESLGHTFRELTEKMQTVTKDIKSDPEIPFMDDGDNEDYRQDVRKSSDVKKSNGVLNLNAKNEHHRSSSW